MSETTPVAVVGAGHMGKHHVRIYSQMPAVRLLAVVDTDIERAKALAEPLGAAWASQIDQFVESVAAVSVAVPTNKHLEVSRPLIERGIAVLIEKPLAPTTEQAAQIVELARRHDAIVQVGHTERFNPAVQAVERLGIHPKFVETHRISPFTFRSADIGVVFDMMIHDIDILLNLVRDEVIRVDAVGVNVLGPHEDIANARVTFRRGAVANLTASRLALKTERKLRVFSETAYVSLDFQKKVGVAITRDKNLDIMRLAREHNLDDLSQLSGSDFGKMINVQPLVIHDTDALSRELEVFIDCVKNHTPPPVSAEDGLAAVRLASKIVDSLSTHRWDGDQSGRVGLSADIFSVAADASGKSR